MQENLVGDNIPTKKNKKKGVEKTIYFADISCSDFEQIGIDGNLKTNLLTILKKSFNENNSNFDNLDDKKFSFSFEGQNYFINIIEFCDEFCFGRLSTEKEYNDILQEYRVNNDIKKSIIINSFTFFYFDIIKKSLVYIGNKNLKNINKIFTKYFEKFTNEKVLISFYGDKALIERVNKAQKLQSLEFQLADNSLVNKSIDEVLSWQRNVNNFEIKIKIKKPSKKYIKTIIDDKNKILKITNPILKFQDENFNDSVSHIFENYFTIKDNIVINEVDIKTFDVIKEKLITAKNRYMV